MLVLYFSSSISYFSVSQSQYCVPFAHLISLEPWPVDACLHQVIALCVHLSVFHMNVSTWVFVQYVSGWDA